MTPLDYLINIALIGLVVLQFRGRRLDRRGLLLPLMLVAWAASQYLHGIPTVGNDLAMVVGGTLLGLTLGIVSAVLTRVEADHDGVAIARATGAAAVLWVLGIGARMGFALYAQHGGAPTIAQFSVAHHLTGPAWVTALVLMAFAEVIGRTLVLWLRSRTVLARQSPALAAA